MLANKTSAKRLGASFGCIWLHSSPALNLERLKGLDLSMERLPFPPKVLRFEELVDLLDGIPRSLNS